jgi:polyhydroxyalkanoate synthase subunit PhaC
MSKISNLLVIPDMLQLIPRLSKVYLNLLGLYNRYNSIYFKTFQENLKNKNIVITVVGSNSNKKMEEFYNSWLELMDREFDTELKSSNFKITLSNFTNSLIELRSLCRKLGYPVDYWDWLFNLYTQYLVHIFIDKPKEFKLAPFDIIYRNGPTRLLHYLHTNNNYTTNKIENTNTKSLPTTSKTANASSSSSLQPLLIIYAPINRFQIMDLNPQKSIVRNLLSNDLDVYLLDWGYPSIEITKVDQAIDKNNNNDYDNNNNNNLSLNDYISYVDNAIQIIKNKTGLDRIPILGYCWGGLIALIYTALHNDSVKNLSLMATPVDFGKDNTILANWSKAIDIDKMMNEFGHMSGQLLDTLFLMRNPPRYTFDKYLKLFKRINDKEFVNTFFDVEGWLYNTPSIPGNIYSQIINDCYKNNLLIQPARMKVNGKKVDIGNVSVPLLIIDAEKDDLVSTDSSIAAVDYVSSSKKEFLTNPGGHVALCISNSALERLWPSVAKWILSN